LYNKASNTPPFKTIEETPVQFIKDFLIIDEEVSYLNKKQSEQKIER